MTKTSNKRDEQEGPGFNALGAGKSRRKQRRLDRDHRKGFMPDKKKPAGETGWRLAF
jgi:hypothetical protein